MLSTDPTRDSALVNFQFFSGDLLSPKMGDEILVDSVHNAPPYGNTHIVVYGNTDLQPYGCSRNTPRMEFKDRLKAARKHAKLNQVELATLAGLTQTSISDLERGKSKGSSFAAQIASVCGVSVMWLVTGKGEMLDRPGATDHFIVNYDQAHSHLDGLENTTQIDRSARQIEKEANELALLASPRSQAALKRIAHAADSGRLTEADIALLEKIAERLAGNQVSAKEGANARITRKLKNAVEKPDRG